MPNPCTAIDEEHPNAPSFLAALLRFESDVVDSPWERPWLYRGQQKQSWCLTPAAWRLDGSSKSDHIHRNTSRYYGIADDIGTYVRTNRPELNIHNVCQAWAAAQAEFELVREFVLLADHVGHSVPGRESYAHELPIVSNAWKQELDRTPSPNFYPTPGATIAVAQHYGVPTRLLDWTRNPLFAALFAAYDVPRSTSEESIAVWVLDKRSLTGPNIPEAMKFSEVKLWRSDNLFLRTQDATLIYAPKACAFYGQHGTWPSLETMVSLACQTSKQPLLYKLKLPASQVGDLLRLLYMKGVTLAHMMPSLNTVASALATKWRWQFIEH